MSAPTPLRLASTDGPYRTVREEGDQRIAAIDIGSNSIRQIVADVSTSGQIRVVDEMKAAPRLGTGLVETNTLSDEADAARDRSRSSAWRRSRASSARSASRPSRRAPCATRRTAPRSSRACGRRPDCACACWSARRRRGSRSAAALAHFELGHGRAVVMDIGGGSLELALSAEGLVERLISLPFGALRLTEQFLGATPRAKDVKKLRKHIREDIQRSLPLRDWRGADVIGSGGTFTNLAGIYLARQGMRAARSVHGTRIPRVEVEHVLEMLQDMTPRSG